MKLIFLFLFLSGYVFSSEQIIGHTNEIQDWKLLLDGSAALNGSLGVDASVGLNDHWTIGGLISTRQIEGFYSVPKPTSFFGVFSRYYPKGIDNSGWYVGGGVTQVNLIKMQTSMGDPINEKTSRVGHVFLGGYEVAVNQVQLPILLRAGLGYGPGSPYVGENVPPDRRFFGGLFDYTFLDVGIGIYL